MKKLNRLLLVSLVFVQLPVLCWSESLSEKEVVVPMEQWQKLKQNLGTLEQNSLKEKELNQKEKELNQKEKELNQKEKELNQKEKELNQKEKELTEKMQTSLTNVNQSLKPSKSETLQSKINVGIVSFSLGAVVGAGACVGLISLFN